MQSSLLRVALGLAASASAICFGAPTVVAPSNDLAELNKVHEMSDLAARGTPPVPTFRGAPVYPYGLRQAGLGGEVLVGFVVDTAGIVREAHAIRSNNLEFERAAIHAVMTWRFKPGQIDGRKVNTRMTAPIVFRIDDGGGGSRFSIDWKAREKLPPEYRWDEPPEPVGTAFPSYPFEALRSDKKAKVKVVFVIGVTGFVVQALFPEPAPPPEFVQAVRAALDLWRFAPAKKGGQPNAAMLSFEFVFSPAGSSDAVVTDTARYALRELKSKNPRLCTLKELDQVPRPISQRPPAYPSELRAQGLDGRAEIEFIIDPSGDAQLPRVVSCSKEEFGYAAAQAVASWRFTVPKKNGQPVYARATIPMGFKLTERPEQTAP